ncbi:MAG: hypothetical protein ABJD11_11900, partial [Gemmatimonadota bacterium]
MYTTCLFCYRPLGSNREIEAFPVGRRLAFDTRKGRLWVICAECRQWNLTPLDERWEAIESCERRFRSTRLRFSTGNIGVAQLEEGLSLVRIGDALRPELAAWRYGRRLRQLSTGNSLPALAGRANLAAQSAIDRVIRSVFRMNPEIEPAAWVRIHRRGNAVLEVVRRPGQTPAVLRYRHLEEAELVRPERYQPWMLSVATDQGRITLSGNEALRATGKLLAAINGTGAGDDDVRSAVQKLDDAGDREGYFSRIVALALRTSWGRQPEAIDELYEVAAAVSADVNSVPELASQAELVALHLSGRSFWGRGGLGSRPRTALPRLPLVDRLALEMAANEDAERRALRGELWLLERAWREA